jgi:hypothetical protein
MKLNELEIIKLIHKYADEEGPKAALKLLGSMIATILSLCPEKNNALKTYDALSEAMRQSLFDFYDKEINR